MLRTFTYVRRAIIEGRSGGESDAFNAWFSAHPYAVLSAAFTDLGVSGLLPGPRRSGFGALLAAIDRDSPDFVLLLRWADLGRDPIVSQHARRQLEARGVVLLSATEPALDLADVRPSA